MGTDSDHEQLEYDVGDWPTTWRDQLELLLRGARIPYEWERPDLLVVPRAHQATVDALVESVEGPEPSARGDDASAASSVARYDAFETRAADQPELASPMRRFIGALVDGIVPGGLSVILIGLGDDARITGAAATAVGLALSFAYFVPSTALYGRTLGKLAVGTTVVAADTGAVPGWRAAIVRFFVPLLPTLLLWGLSDTTLSVIGLLWAVAVYAPVLGPSRRGLHDRAAGTVVIAPIALRPFTL